MSFQLNKIVGAVVILAISIMCLPAKASVFSWDVQPSIFDELSIKLQNWEPSIADVQAGGLLFGVGRVTTIENLTTGDTAWSADANSELTFVFNNYAVANVVAGSLIQFTGGNMTLYFDDTPDTNSAVGNKLKGTNAAPDNPGDTQNFSNGMKLVDFVGAPNGAGFTLETQIGGNIGNLLGFGTGLLDVVPGSGPLASVLDGNSQAFGADLDLFTTLQDSNAAPGFYEVFSNDPIDTKYVPEPTTIAIWGMMIAMAAGASYRRSRA